MARHGTITCLLICFMCCNAQLSNAADEPIRAELNEFEKAEVRKEQIVLLWDALVGRSQDLTYIREKIGRPEVELRMVKTDEVPFAAEAQSLTNPDFEPEYPKLGVSVKDGTGIDPNRLLANKTKEPLTVTEKIVLINFMRKFAHDLRESYSLYVSARAYKQKQLKAPANDSKEGDIFDTDSDDQKRNSKISATRKKLVDLCGERAVHIVDENLGYYRPKKVNFGVQW